MFKPIQMKEVNLFVLNKDLQRVTNIIYELKLVEFFEKNPVHFDKFETENLDDMYAHLLKIRSTITFLKEYYTQENKKKIDMQASEKATHLKERLDEVHRKIIHLKDNIKRKKILAQLQVTKEDVTTHKVIVGFIDTNKSALLSQLTKQNIKFKQAKIGERIYFKAYAKKILFPFKEFYIPKSFEKDLEKQLLEKEKEIKSITNKIKELANSNLKYMQREELKVRKEISLREAKKQFAKTSNICVLSGFVPNRSIKKLQKALESRIEENYELEINDVTENIPVQLDNNAAASKFEELLKMYSLPKYGEFDPTLFIFMVFPLFYGFILGDVVYGLLSLAVFSLAKLKLKNLKNFLSILQISSLSSIVFGFIYGEFMGFEFTGPFYGLFERSHSPEQLLIFAVLFGVLHINLGLIIGFFNEIKNIKKAVYDKLSWIVLEVAVILLALGFTGNNSIEKYIGWSFFIIALALIYLGHGFIGIMEVPSFFTNILSYARLMAVGLSSIAIAVLINDYTIILFDKGILGILGAIVLFTVGHIFNIVLGNFESFLHTLRLHYVEFFTKFYTGGGKEFTPFGANDDYLKNQ